MGVVTRLRLFSHSRGWECQPGKGLLWLQGMGVATRVRLSCDSHRMGLATRVRLFSDSHRMGMATTVRLFSDSRGMKVPNQSLWISSANDNSSQNPRDGRGYLKPQCVSFFWLLETYYQPVLGMTNPVPFAWVSKICVFKRYLCHLKLVECQAVMLQAVNSSTQEAGASRSP